METNLGRAQDSGAQNNSGGSIDVSQASVLLVVTALKGILEAWKEHAPRAAQMPVEILRCKDAYYTLTAELGYEQAPVRDEVSPAGTLSGVELSAGTLRAPVSVEPEVPSGYARYRCEACQARFTARIADRKRGWAKFCSKSCKAKKQERQTGQHAPYQQHKG